ncbi:MAG: nitroreductase family protein [Chloroflexi bacterium]|nr:nitroreductase family protein [Chloroflexota bacterium]
MTPSAQPAAALRSLRQVRQVRQFTDQPVTDAQLDAIVDVGRWSGSSRNTQPWRFLVLADRDLVRRVGEAGAPHTRALLTAPAAIAIAVPAAGAAVSFAYDEGRAAERMLIAAGMVGLAAGIAWVAPDHRASAAGLLRVPDGWIVRTLIALGHPTDEARQPKSAPGAARRPREDMVTRDGWSDRLAPWEPPT